MHDWEQCLANLRQKINGNHCLTMSAFRNVPKVSIVIRRFMGFNLKYQTHNLKITYNSSEYIPCPIISYKIYFPLQIPFQILDIPT